MTLDLSIIILSYNTSNLTKNCLDSLVSNLSKYKNLKSEIIVVDNASSDSSVPMIQNVISNTKFNNLNIKLLINDKNVGYTKGNNQGIKIAKGRYVLFLNSDTEIKEMNFENIIDRLDREDRDAVLTTQVLLVDGNIDPASHRGFPTLWNSFCYFLGLENFFGKIPLLNRIFGGYHLTYYDLNTEHEIDSPTGAFYLVKKSVLDQLSGFDEKNFFMYGEDLDLSFRIKKLGYKIIYYPFFSVLHIKRASGLNKKDQSTNVKTKDFFYNAMKAFYQKHYATAHPAFINNLVYSLIDIKKKIS